MQELKFGTETPIEYNEKQLGMTIGIKVIGKITFHEEIRDEKKDMILSPFMRAISSKLKEYEEKNIPLEHLAAMGLEMNHYLEGILDALNAPGKVNIIRIMPDEDSRKAIEAKTLAASPEAMAEAQRQAVAQAQAAAQALAQTPAAATPLSATAPAASVAPLSATIPYKPAKAKSNRPKFCTNCGSPVGPTGSYCINCGNRLSGMI